MRLRMVGAPYPFRLVQSVPYGQAPGLPSWQQRLYLDLVLPESPLPRRRPAVVFFHGGGWEAGTKEEVMTPWYGPLLAAHGFVVASVGYRLSQVSKFPAQLHDAKAAVRWLRAQATDYNIDPDRIGALGASAGAHLAALLGVTGDVDALEGPCGSDGFSSRVQAVAAFCCPSDFLRWRFRDDSPITRLFGGPRTEREDLMRLGSPALHVRPGAPPFLLVHGTEDETVPFEQGKVLAAALEHVDAEVALHVVPGAYHNLRDDVDLPWSNQPWEELGRQALAFFEHHLNPNRAS